MNMRLAVLVGRNGVLSIKQWMYKWATRVRWPCTRNRAHHMPTTAHIQIKAINVWIWPSNFTVKFDACGMVAAETDSFYHISNVHKIGVATEYYDENIRIYLCNFIFNATRTFCPPYDAVCARAHVRCGCACDTHKDNFAVALYCDSSIPLHHDMICIFRFEFPVHGSLSNCQCGSRVWPICHATTKSSSPALARWSVQRCAVHFTSCTVGNVFKRSRRVRFWLLFLNYIWLQTVLWMSVVCACGIVCIRLSHRRFAVDGKRRAHANDSSIDIANLMPFVDIIIHAVGVGRASVLHHEHKHTHSHFPLQIHRDFCPIPVLYVFERVWSVSFVHCCLLLFGLRCHTSMRSSCVQHVYGMRQYSLLSSSGKDIKWKVRFGVAHKTWNNVYRIRMKLLKTLCAHMNQTPNAHNAHTRFDGRTQEWKTWFTCILHCCIATVRCCWMVYLAFGMWQCARLQCGEASTAQRTRHMCISGTRCVCVVWKPLAKGKQWHIVVRKFAHFVLISL